MTYRGHVKNGAVVLDPPAALPEGAAVEVSVVAGANVAESSLPPQRPPITSLDALRSKLPGDPFGPEFEETLRKWRSGPWRSVPQEPLE
jgi:hypothetical protein